MKLRRLLAASTLTAALLSSSCASVGKPVQQIVLEKPVEINRYVTVGKNKEERQKYLDEIASEVPFCFLLASFQDL